VGLTLRDDAQVGRAVVPAATLLVCAGAVLHGGVIEAAWVGAATFTALGVARRMLLDRGTKGSLVIVPWGVLVVTGGDVRAIPWYAVKDVELHVRHGKDGGTAIVTDSTLTVSTGRERLFGVAPGSIGLESVLGNLDRWSAESDAPIASDLEGDHALEVEVATPRFAELSEAALLLADAPRDSGVVAPLSGYRGVSDASSWRGSSTRLRAILRSREITTADPRPLAALVAARIGAVSCIPDLLRLVSAPNGFVALVAKACALRLGAPLERAGALDEVAAFVSPEDLAEATAFVEEQRPSGLIESDEPVSQSA
jgi:hypothetical protein